MGMAASAADHVPEMPEAAGKDLAVAQPSMTRTAVAVMEGKSRGKKR